MQSGLIRSVHPQSRVLETEKLNLPEPTRRLQAPAEAEKPTHWNRWQFFYKKQTLPCLKSDVQTIQEERKPRFTPPQGRAAMQQDNEGKVLI